MSKAVIIVAGGGGTRMGSSLPKQFLSLAGRPVLMHTLDIFSSIAGIRLIVVLPKEQIEFWHSLCKEYHYTFPHDITEGGTTRHGSVSNGLALVADETLVAIHDGVRPLVSRQTIERCFAEAALHGNAIPVMPSVESVRVCHDDGTNTAADRNTIMMVQTPQVFRTEEIKKAYRLPYSPLFTDDASVAEAAGYAIHLTEGNIGNIKLTTPSDMMFAQAMLRHPETT